MDVANVICAMCIDHKHMRKNFSEDECVQLFGILEGEKFDDVV